MDLLQVTVELRHAKPLKLFRPYEELYRSLTGKDLPEKVTPLPGFRLDIGDKLMEVVVDARRTAIVMGDVPNIGHCADAVGGVFRKTSEIAELPGLERLGIRSLWVQSSELQFSELMSLHKQVFYKTNVITEQATDIGAAFVSKDGECIVRLSFGPMEPEQLRTMLSFERRSLPEVGTFLDVDYYRWMNQEKATERMLHAFVRRGMEYASEQGQKVVSVLREGVQ